MQVLVVVPARGGSKGVPKKNSRVLGKQPLLFYTLQVARRLVPANQIYLSTDSPEIAGLASEFGLSVPSLRPENLATDEAGMYPVLRHALENYQSREASPDVVILLQPTSPFRTAAQVQEALKLFSPELDMVVSVKQTRANPYFVLYEEDEAGFLEKSKTSAGLVRRQDAPKVYELNGAIYIIKVRSLLKYNSFSEFTRIRKYEMDELTSLDIDTELDWQFCEFLLQKGVFKGNGQF